MVLVGGVAGTKLQVSPACTLEQHLNRHFGFVHVHLPLDLGFAQDIRYIGFSASDYRGSVQDQDRLALVTNGDEVFALVRTVGTPSIAKFSKKDFEEWDWRYTHALAQAKADIENGGASASDAVNRRLYEVNEYLCQLLQFGFYAGLWGEPIELVYRPE